MFRIKPLDVWTYLWTWEYKCNCVTDKLSQNFLSFSLRYFPRDCPSLCPYQQTLKPGQNARRRSRWTAVIFEKTGDSRERERESEFFLAAARSLSRLAFPLERASRKICTQRRPLTARNSQRSLTTRRSRERALGCSARHAALFIWIHTASLLSATSVSMRETVRTRPNTELHSAPVSFPKLKHCPDSLDSFLTKNLLLKEGRALLEWRDKSLEGISRFRI